MNPKADLYIQQVHHLLPAPSIIPRLMKLVGTSESNNSEIVDLIYHDPSLTANVLRISNSSFYGIDRKIDSLDEAVMRIGARELYRIVVAISSAIMLTHLDHRKGREENALLDHSVAAATGAQFLAAEIGEDENLAFTATLLHDLGKIVIAAVSENFYGYAQEVKDTETDLLAAEERVLGVTHAEVGGRLLEHWQFPDNLIQAVQFHHRPVFAPQHQRLAACLNLANGVAYNLNRAYGHQRPNPDLTIETINLLGINRRVLDDCAARVSENLQPGSPLDACVQSLPAKN